MDKLKVTYLLIAIFVLTFVASRISNASNEPYQLYLGTDNVYYTCQGGDNAPITPQTDDSDNKISNIDLGSVKIINNTFFTDKNNVYYISTFNTYCYFNKLDGVDSVSFKVLNNFYEKDKNNVYHNTFYHGGPAIDKVADADSATFEVFKEDGEYAMDKIKMYFQGKVLGYLNITITNAALYNSLKGKIILKVESNGEAYYISPSTKKMFFLSRPVIAFQVMREQGVGITNANLEKIPVAGNCPSYNSNCDKTNKHNTTFAKSKQGKIFIQVEENGEAWYVNPAGNKRYFLGRPTDAFNIMKNLGMGISNVNFEKMKNNEINITTGWKTYSNNRYNYTIKYPNNWYIETTYSENNFTKRGLVEDNLYIGGDTTFYQLLQFI